MAGQPPPNIVLMTADQLGARFVGCYGSGVDSTPCLDSLAEDGIRFTRYYAACPVCAPNRATMLTGRSPEIHGVVSNNFALAGDTPTFAHVLQRHGYHTGIFGKIHQTPMTWAPPENVCFLGFDESLISEDPKWGPWIDWVQERYPEHYATALAMTNSHSGVRSAIQPMDLAQGAAPEQTALKTAVYEDTMQQRMDASPWDRMYPSPLPAEVHDTVFITESGLEFIQRSAQNPQKPFFCHISYVDPHDSYDPPEPYASMFDPAEMPDPISAEWMAQGPSLLDGNRDSYLKFRTICDDPSAIKHLRALYHGSIRLIDAQIQRVVDYLQASGLWENTILIFTTDHGDMMGDHGLIAKGTPHYDTGIRCPFIVAGGPVTQAVDGTLLCSLDLFPTLCAWAGVDPADMPPVEGLSFAFEADRTQIRKDRHEIAVSIGTVDSILSAEGWRLTRFSGDDAGQMFHLVDDPDEQHNLYDDPRYTAVKLSLLEHLIKLRTAPRVRYQYRTLPLRENKRWDANSHETWPNFDLAPSPWVTGEDKPEWHGEAKPDEKLVI